MNRKMVLICGSLKNFSVNTIDFCGYVKLYKILFIIGNAIVFWPIILVLLTFLLSIIFSLFSIPTMGKYAFIWIIYFVVSIFRGFSLSNLISWIPFLLIGIPIKSNNLVLPCGICSRFESYE